MPEIASLVISVDSTGSDNAVRSLRDLAQQGAVTEAAVKKTGDSGHALKNVSREADAASRSMDMLATAAKAALASMGISEVIRLSDTYQKYTAQLKLATGSVEGFAKAQADVREIAKRAQADLEGTAVLYARIANGTRELGLSQEKVARVTEAVSLALRVSGATAEESASAMLQLSQAFASGVLRGEEFNAVNEAAPRLMKALADGTGVAVGALRQMAADGEITAEVMARALPAALKDLRKEAEQIQTIGGAFTNLRNEVLELVGTQAQVTGFSKAIASGISLIADNLEVLAVAGVAGLARYTAGIGAAAVATAAKAVQSRAAALEELNLAKAHAASAAAAAAQTRALTGLTIAMGGQSAAADALQAANARLAAAQAAAGTAGRGLLAILGGPAGIAITAGLAATAFMTMGGSARAASADIDTLSSSLSDLTQKQLELRRVELEDQVASLEEKAIESSQALLGLHRDFDALYTSAAQGANITAAELENVKRTILEQEVAHEKNSAALDKARLLLDQVVGRLRDLELAARGAAGGIDGLNRAMGFTEAGEKYLAQIQARIKALQDGGDPVKAATRWILEHANASEADKTAIMSAALAEKALIEARDRAAKATKSGAQAVNEAKKAEEAFERSRRQYLNGLYGEISAMNAQAKGLEEQIALYGLAESAKYDLAIADLEAQKAALAVIDAGAEEIAILERKIELLGQMRGSQQTLERLDAEKAAWESWSRDVEQIFQQVGQSLTDALFEGGRSARDLIKDLFKTLTLRVLVQPVMTGLQGLFMGAGPAGVANAAGAGGGMLGNASSLFSMFGGNSMGMGISNALTSLSSSSMLAGTGVGNWMTGVAGNVAGMSNLALGGAGLLGGIGAGLLFGNKGYSSAGGGVGGTLGMALGGPVGAVAGSLLGGALGSLFGDDEPRTRHAQMSHADLGADGTFSVTTWDDRQSRESQNAAAAYATEAVRNATELFDKIGIDAEFKRFTTLMESSILGDKQGVGSSGTIRIGDLEHEIGLAIESSWTKHGVGGWSEAEMLPRLMTDVQLTILEAFQAAGDSLPDVLSGMLEGVDIRSLGAEQAQELAQRFQLVVEQVSAVQEAINSLPFEQLRDLSFDAAANLIQFAGGVEQLNAGMTSYFQNFYSQEEQLQFATEQLGKAFGELGLELPDVSQGAQAAKAAYRDIVESLDVTTEEGQRAYATLMTLSGGFAELVTGMDELNNAVVETARSAADIAREREGLERQWLQINGNTAELRRRDLEALDESNRALQRLIWTRQDEAQAAQDAAAAWQQAQADLGTALGVLRQQAQAEITRLQQSFAGTDTAYRAVQTMAQGIERELQGVFDNLGRHIRDLRGEVDSTARMQYDRARAVISTALVTGKLPQTADLNEALQIARDGVSNRVYASQLDQERAYIRLANEMEALQAIAEPELDTARKTLREAERQYNALRGIADTSSSSLDVLLGQLSVAIAAEESARIQIAGIESQLAWAQAQHDALLGIKSGVDRFPAALQSFASALSAAQAAQVSAGSGGSYGGGAAPSNDAYYEAKLAQLKATGSQHDGINWAYATVSDLKAYFNSLNLTPLEHWEKWGGKHEGLPRPSFAVGTAFVPYDMTADIHAREAVIDARSMDILRTYGIRVQAAGSQELVAEIRALREQNARLEGRLASIERSTGQLADQFDNVSAGGNALATEVMA